MMKRTTYLVMTLVLLGVFTLAFTGCSESTKPTPPAGPATSVDEFLAQEPVMADNPSRATVTSGGVGNISIPDYLVPSGMRRSEVNAHFAIHPDDTEIAEIVGSPDGASCQIRGLQLGSARVIITVGSASASVIIAVSPSEPLFTLPAGLECTLANTTYQSAWWNDYRPDSLPDDYASYVGEPTMQLAWKWRNNTTNYGASGTNCGFDLLSYFVDPVVPDRRGWTRTTYGFGGWHYDLNGVTNGMVDGVQTVDNVRLTLTPRFIYDNGKPYLEMTQTVTNLGTTRLEEQKFGASADVMIFNRDSAPVYNLTYGALMTNAQGSYLPTMKLRLVCQNIRGIDDVSTMWIGRYSGERNHVYDDQREPITPEAPYDSALNFSYQNITLDPGESKDFVIRFTSVQ